MTWDIAPLSGLRFLVCNGNPSPPDGCCEARKASLTVETPHTEPFRWLVADKPKTRDGPPSSPRFWWISPCVFYGFLFAPSALAITSTSVSEIPFYPLLSLCAYVFFPWKFPSTFEAPVPVPLVPKSVPAPGLLAGDLKYCLIPRTNSKQNVELGRAPFSSPQALAAEVPGFFLPQIKADLWPEAEIPFHSSESNRYLNEGENLCRNSCWCLPKRKMLDSKHRR